MSTKNRNSIKLQKVNLHYSALAYKNTSLKSYVFNALSRNKKQTYSDIHALRNINLEINPGDRLALIGHNGAGKSTLLKAIAKIYPISSGKCEVAGQVRALFELSLGFESEATGRENIMYRSLLLGQKPKHIRQIEKEIIQFADIGDFIDYPIKTYSSGMLVRLAFAISTIIPGDILLLDEVLGAGDLAFMTKARDRVMSLINHAEIIVFASHDFDAVKKICNKAIVLQNGKIVYSGTPQDAITSYKSSVEAIQHGK